MSETALKHIEHLSITIGPRGTATPEERAAHDYVAQALAGLGYEPRREAVQVYPSIYQPFILGMSLMLLAVFLFYNFGGAGALAAAFLALLVTVSSFLELLLQDNPLRWFLPPAQSENVLAVARPEGEAPPRRKVVLLAHVDTHRTPFIFSSPGAFMFYRGLSTLGMIGLPAGVVVFAIGALGGGSDLLRQVALGLSVLYGLLLLLVLQAEFSEHTRGANDNASGVGVLLALAERLRAEPLPETEVWLLATTGEETGGFGMRDFLARHKDELQGAVFLNVDSAAGAGPCYLRSETFLKTYRYPPAMLALAEKAAAERPELGVYTQAMQGLYTDAAWALQAGFPALSFVGFNKDGWIPLLHNPDDEFEYVDKQALDRTEQFVWEVLRRLGNAEGELIHKDTRRHTKGE